MLHVAICVCTPEKNTQNIEISRLVLGWNEAVWITSNPRTDKHAIATHHLDKTDRKIMFVHLK